MSDKKIPDNDKTRKNDTESQVLYNEPIPTLFADGFHGVTFSNNTVRLNLYQDKFNANTQKTTRHIVTRLILPLDEFSSVVSVLNEIKAQAVKSK